MASRFHDLRRRLAGEKRFLTASLELTYRCNFHCVHCYCVVGGPQQELATDEWYALLDELKAAGCLSVTLTGGEAMLRPDFFEIAGYAKRRRFVMRLFTNALLIDDERLERVLDLGLIAVEISLYGASAETYRRVAGHPGFERVARNIDALIERGQHVFLKIPLMQENFDDLDAMVAFCRERGVGYNIDPWMTPKDDGTMGPTGSQISEAQLREFLAKYGRPLPRVERDPGKELCTIGRGSAIVSPYGDVFGCVQSKIPAGNVRETPIAEIWRSAPLLEKERAIRFGDFPQCGACEFRESCFICPSVSYYENGRFNGPSKYACQAAQLRYELGQIESRPVLFDIRLPGRPATAPRVAPSGRSFSEEHSSDAA